MLPGIGVFGTNSLVKILIPILKESGFKVEAIWCKKSQEAKDLALEMNIPCFTSNIDDVLLKKEIDLIFVLCAPYLHAQISVKALGIGKHVVCDRPAGLNQYDALRMVKAAQYYPSLITIISYSFRFLPVFMQMKRLIESGYLVSDITLIEIQVNCSYLYENNEEYNWLSDDTMGGGVLNLIGSHIVDLVYFLTNKRAIKVHAVLKILRKHSQNINGIRYKSAPDFCSFQLELEGGILVCATLNSYSSTSLYQEKVIVSSDNAYLLAKGGNLYGSCNQSNEVTFYEAASSTNLLKTIATGLSNMIVTLKEAFMPVKQRAGWIKEPVNNAANFEDGLYVQAVLSALKESSKSLQWTKVNVMSEHPDTNALLSAAVRRTTITIS